MNYTPLKQKERIAFIDLLRGFALLGILMVNLPLMNAPFTTEYADFALWTDKINVWSNLFIKFFFASKFYVLFSMLFGVGFYYFMQKAESQTKGIIRLFRIRLLWLLFFGILHIIFLWYGDILALYALMGFVLIWFRNKSNKSLLIWAGVLILLPVLFMGLMMLLYNLAMHIPEAADSMNLELEKQYLIMKALSEQTMHIYANGSFSEIISVRLTEYKHVTSALIYFAPNVLAMFLIGLVVARKSILVNIEAKKSFFRKLIFISLPIALVANSLFTYYATQSSMIILDEKMFFYLLGSAIGGPSLAFVYIGILALLLHKNWFSGIKNLLVKMGRMAFTNYLSHSIIGTTLFYSYGLGLYGSVQIWQGILITLAIFTFQLFFCNWWLNRYKFGPLEWIWRSLTYFKWQSMRKQKEL